MKTLFLDAVAALVLSSNAALATTHTISLDGYCDVFTLTTQDRGQKLWSFESIDTGGCEKGFGFGGVSKAKSLGNGAFANMGGVLFHYGDKLLWALQIQVPVQTGGKWYVFNSTDGVRFTEINTGTYTVAQDRTLHLQGRPAIFGR